MTAIVLRSELHPNGQLMHHVGDLDGIRVEAHQNEQAYNARTAGVWFLTIGVAGHPLRCHSQHRTLSDARAFANAVIAEAGINPTHAQLVKAHDYVEAGPVLFADVELETAEPADQPEAAGPIVVIPCSAQKLDHAAPAGQLYTSQHFQLVYRAARKLADDQGARVLILSALHGLVDPETVLDPYDVKMGDRGAIAPAAIAEQLAAINPTAITTLLPRAYRLALVRAGAVVTDLYADAAGIGYQRGVASQILASRQHAVATDPAGYVYAGTLF
ncbi:hypothetical protein KDW72_gp57 [Mycobacterium phage Grizzly]|uniref:DUF6884 domain-containing protein n=1 Tax=Mycobacterium phage Grizzly TaxID=2315539 RepID=A0A386KF93_9CAUD|nr:hypothetical protein KDW72_gp57 [Mycobacterium phage Grizzly]AYD84020.1 hypothetical protein SEA_GRIZZLY_57 [Mycobacterium phage Grizzly]QPL15277.1 hypothetical protein SEA_PEEB_57 [Mycobacterium phage Peeb]UXQ88520.1 hypothetical protein [Mycobacterium phage Kashi_BG2]WDE67702.1 oxidoreductase [Mycobacterium phage RitVan]